MSRDSLVRRLATVAIQPPEGEPSISSRTPAFDMSSFLPELLTLVMGHLHPAQSAPQDHSASIPGRGSSGWRPRKDRNAQRSTDPGEDDTLYAGYRKRDLLVCSLVSHGWRAAARPHLFRELTFVVRRPHYKKGVVPYKTLDDYLTLLRASPEIGAYIRRLHLEYPDQYRTGQSTSEDTQKLSPASLLRLLHTMPHLEHLKLCNILLSSPPPLPTDDTSDVSRPLAVNHLEIRHQVNGAAWAVHDIHLTMVLGLFRAATHLHLAGMGIVDSDGWNTEYTGPAKLDVSRLVVERAHNGDTLFRCLKDSGALSQLRSLVVRMVTTLEREYDMLKKREFIAAVSPTVEEVCIYLQRPAMPYGDNIIDISSFASLRRLVLRFTILTGNLPACRHVLGHVLRSFPIRRISASSHPRFEELILLIAFDVTGAIMDTPQRSTAWREQLSLIDQRLVDVAQACGLRGVTVVCTATIGRVDGVATLGRMFPLLKQLGLLKVEDVSPQVWQTTASEYGMG